MPSTTIMGSSWVSSAYSLRYPSGDGFVVVYHDPSYAPSTAFWRTPRTSFPQPWGMGLLMMTPPLTRPNTKFGCTPPLCLIFSQAHPQTRSVENQVYLARKKVYHVHNIIHDLKVWWAGEASDIMSSAQENLREIRHKLVVRLHVLLQIHR